MIDVFGQVPQEAMTQNAVVKTQAIRLLDVFLIGPLMVYGGVQTKGVLGYTLAAFGVATVVFNGVNYLMVERTRRDA